MRTLLIDGDTAAWLAAFNADGDAGPRAVRWVRRRMYDLEADRAIVALSDPTHRYWRHELAATYKARRSVPPDGLQDAVAAMRDGFPCRQLPGLEADDVLGLLATHPAVEGERIIVAVDKDLLTVPGLHFNPRKPELGVSAVGERQAAINHLTQTLCGDANDGYGGCPGVGPAKVKRILWGDPWQWWTQVVLAFKGARLTEADALTQARLARILRHGEYDYDNRRPILWTPERLTTKETECPVTTA